jgi:hypothetical protein
MDKYIIEGGIDFYNELYKSLDDVDDINISNENFCLITNTALGANFVTLDCGHKFNYEPLFNDIVNHKKKYNNMERCIVKAMNVRCPYCRKIQNKLLPYYEDLKFEKTHGVNYFDNAKILADNIAHMNISSPWVTGQCCFEFLDSSANNILCGNTYVMMIDVIGKSFCSQHKYTAYKNFLNKKKMDLKQKVKDEKMKAKIEAKSTALLAKEIIKHVKLLKKNDKNDKKENVIVFLNLCNEVIKTGPNKGKGCGCKIFKDNMCTRHFNLCNKIDKNNVNIVINEINKNII